MTWGEYLAYSIGTYKREVERWQMVRKISHTQAAVMGLDKSEDEFMPLPFDNLHQDAELSSEDLEEYIKQFRNAER